MKSSPDLEGGLRYGFMGVLVFSQYLSRIIMTFHVYPICLLWQCSRLVTLGVREKYGLLEFAPALPFSTILFSKSLTG